MQKTILAIMAATTLAACGEHLCVQADDIQACYEERRPSFGGGSNGSSNPHGGLQDTVVDQTVGDLITPGTITEVADDGTTSEVITGTVVAEEGEHVPEVVDTDTDTPPEEIVKQEEEKKPDPEPTEPAAPAFGAVSE